MGCRIKDRTDWTIRLRNEIHTKALEGYGSSFVTLTYADENLKGYIDGSSFYPSLVKSDLQDFNKRFRQYIKRHDFPTLSKDFKYFAVGEYGDDFGRPHYHIIYCGLESEAIKSFIRKEWNLGLTQVLSVSNALVRYLLKYIDKQQHGSQLEESYPHVEPPFHFISKGIGTSFYKEHIETIRKEGGIFVDGSLKLIPSYYRKRYGVELPDDYINTIKFFEKSKQVRSGMESVKYYQEQAYVKELKAVNGVRLESPCDSSVLDSHTSDIRSSELLVASLVEATQNP